MNTCASHVVHRLYTLKNDNMSLPGYYQFMQSTNDHTNTSYDVTVAEFVNKWL